MVEFFAKMKKNRKTEMGHRRYLSKSEMNAEYRRLYGHKNTTIESNEDKAVRYIKDGAFDRCFGMSFEDFVTAYNNVKENHPERLI